MYGTLPLRYLFFIGGTPGKMVINGTWSCGMRASGRSFSPKECPWVGLHIMEVGRFPFVLRVCCKERGGEEVITVGISHMGPEFQVFCQGGRGDLRLGGAAGEEGRPTPLRAALGVGINAAPEDPTAGFPGFGQLIIAIAFDRLSRFGINAAFV